MHIQRSLVLTSNCLDANAIVAERGGILHPPPKFWAVGKLLEMFLLSVFVQKTYGAKIPVLGKFRDKIAIFEQPVENLPCLPDNCSFIPCLLCQHTTPLPHIVGRRTLHLACEQFDSSNYQKFTSQERDLIRSNCQKLAS